MATNPELLRASQIIFDGNLELGEQLVRAIIDNPAYSNGERAYAFYLLSKTRPDSFSFQKECLEKAYKIHPTQENRERLERLLRGEKPTGNTQPLQTGRFGPRRQLEYGVNEALTGAATAFYIDQRGLLATTRSAIGSRSQVTLSKGNSNSIVRVVRSYPEYDLAFLKAEDNVYHVQNQSDMSMGDRQQDIQTRNYLNRVERGLTMPNSILDQNDGNPIWIATNYTTTIPTSYNGAPVINTQGDVVGMLTRNYNRDNSLVYALHISVIQRLRNAYFQDTQLRGYGYCGKCGSLSRAAYERMLYCEVCGSVLPEHEQGDRIFSKADAQRYSEYTCEKNRPQRPPMNPNTPIY